MARLPRPTSIKTRCTTLLHRRPRVERLEDRWLLATLGGTPEAESCGCGGAAAAAAAAAEEAAVAALVASDPQTNSVIESGGGGGVVNDLLPDVTPLASQENGWIYGWSLDTSEQPRRTLLRLSTAMHNIGDGAVHIRGGAALPNGNQAVYQRIFNDGPGPNNWREVLAGEFTYHASHGHTHFDGFAQYHLRSVTEGNGVGDIVASGDKISFCLLDLEKIDPLAGPEVYSTCTTTRQGISPGWADIYDRSLPDQWVDVTDIEDGQYWLEVTVDPDNHLVELDETNNTTRILIDLNTAGDTYEPNDTSATAFDLGLRGDFSVNDLSIHVSDNDDYFKFTAAASGTVNIDLFFEHDLGDIDTEVRRSNGTEMDSSQSIDDTEHMTFTATAGQVYIVQIYGYAGATNPSYDLVIDGPALPPDALETNNSFATARDLGTVGTYSASNLSIHLAGNDDYYKLTAARDGNVEVDLSYIQAQGALGLEVYDTNQVLLDGLTTASDFENIQVAMRAGEVFFVRVYGPAGAVNPQYSLAIQLEALPGDYNNDRIVDNADYVFWRKTLNTPLTPYHGADGDGDGMVDDGDHVVWTAHFGETLPLPAGGNGASVPGDSSSSVREAVVVDTASGKALSEAVVPRKKFEPAAGFFFDEKYRSRQPENRPLGIKRFETVRQQDRALVAWLSQHWDQKAADRDAPTSPDETSVEDSVTRGQNSAAIDRAIVKLGDLLPVNIAARSKSLR